MLSSDANVPNSKLLQALYAFDSPVPLAETLGLSGEFFSYDKGGTAFLGLLDLGLNSNCVHSWNPLMVSGCCLLTLINLPISQLYCACACFCVRVRVCMSVNVCACLVSSYSGHFSQQSQILGSGRKLVLSNANKS